MVGGGGGQLKITYANPRGVPLVVTLVVYSDLRAFTYTGEVAKILSYNII